MKKYEYKIVKGEKKSKFSGIIDPQLSETLLTGYGLQGWRLSQTVTYSGTTGAFILEREV